MNRRDGEGASRLRLLPSSPNPFRGAATLSYELPASVPVRLSVHDAAGVRVRALRSGKVEDAGTHTVVWDGRDDAGNVAPSGIYFVRLQSAESAATRKILKMQ